jgi:cytochrome oxidase assembly protein ShyY1
MAASVDLINRGTVKGKHRSTQKRPGMRRQVVVVTGKTVVKKERAPLKCSTKKKQKGPFNPQNAQNAESHARETKTKFHIAL